MHQFDAHLLFSPFAVEVIDSATDEKLADIGESARKQMENLAQKKRRKEMGLPTYGLELQTHDEEVCVCWFCVLIFLLWAFIIHMC
jgi:hypothetical protein